MAKTRTLVATLALLVPLLGLALFGLYFKKGPMS